MKTMNLKKYKYLIACGVFAVMQSSCEDLCDSFLTQKNENEMTTDVFWANLSDCKTGLTAVYNTFKNQGIYQMVADNNRSDLTWPGVWPKYPSTTNVYYLHTFNDASTEIGSKWATLYQGIFRANQVIDGLNKIEKNMSSDSDKKDWSLLMGQARFFRGLFHFYLNISFNKGNVPIMDFVPQSEADFFISSSTSEKVKEFYRSDLEYAESVLPIKGQPVGSDRADWQASNNDLGRVTSGAATAVLGTSYLYDNEYDKAKDYFKKIINNSNYSLAKSCGDNYTSKNEFNSESILEINYTHEFNSEYDVYSQTILSNTLNMQFAPGSCGGWGPTVFPSYWLQRAYTYEPVDKRDSRNKVYLKTDAHGDILYMNTMTYSETTQNGKTYRSYPILNTKDMCYYTKKIEVDKSGNPVIADKSLLPASSYTKLVSGALTAQPLKWQIGDGTWEIYYDEEGKPYRYRNHSLRASYSIFMPTECDLPYYGFGQPLDAGLTSNAYGAFRKYTNWDTRTTEKDSPKNMDSDINVRLIRLADVYLMYAESLIKGGSDESGVSEALRYINRVRHRAGTTLIGSQDDALAEYRGNATYQDTPDLESGDIDYTFYQNDNDPKVITSSKQVMNHLMYIERPLELSVEGYAIRFNDLRRWGIVKQRFEELSKKAFTTWAVPYVGLVKSKSTFLKCSTQWGCAFDYPVKDSYKGSISGPQYQYDQSAVNYNDDKAYYPIPADETVSNPNVVKVLDK